MMNDVHMEKTEFSIGTGIAITLIWLLVISSISCALYVLLQVIPGMIIPVTIPPFANYAGFWATRKVLDARRWPQQPGILNLLGKWVAIFGLGIISLSTLILRVGFYFYLIPLLVMPPIIVGWVSTSILLVRRLKVRPEAINPRV
ncbi:MAG: hypothetical protein ACKO85_19460 [Isosphaeraceae bacterium]